jgi:hypothetical protein
MSRFNESADATPCGRTRRVFLLRVATAGAGAALLAAAPAAHAAPHVEENDDTAVALGYRHDARRVDAAKFPKDHAGEKCLDCSFFQGAPADEWAGCAMFGRKHINAAGWCNAWAKKPG